MSLRTVILLVLAALVGAARGVELSAGTNALVLAVTTNHCIPCALSGRVTVVFADVVTLFQQPDVLDLIQEEYARQLPAGVQPEFAVKPCGTNVWSYVNKDRQYSEIHEISRVTAPDGRGIDLVYYSRGQRFFGPFRAAIAVRLTPDGDDGALYAVRVWAFPEGAFPRFFARHLGLVERYFREKTVGLTALTVRIATGLSERLAGRRQAATAAGRTGDG